MYLKITYRSECETMKVAVLGAGLMGRSITYDLLHQKTFEAVTLVDNDQTILSDAEQFLLDSTLNTVKANALDASSMKKIFNDVDVLISAIPYYFNYDLTQLAIKLNTHFIDLGGNNTIVNKQRQLFSSAKKHQVTVVADSGLAPGLVSVITKDIVDSLSETDVVQLRVGGLPLIPEPPFQYQIVFSIDGLINEYVEDALILDHGIIKYKPSMTEIESLTFPEPFGNMEAFLTSGGCSTLPFTYQQKIKYLDYKTIRYPGHCVQFKSMLDIGLANRNPIDVNGQRVSPRDVFIELLKQSIPSQGFDVVLLKVVGQGKKQDSPVCLDYTMIDRCDKKTGLSAMMRTTGFPVAITADFIAKNVITEHGVFCPEEVIPPVTFFKELEKRRVIIKKTETVS